MDPNSGTFVLYIKIIFEREVEIMKKLTAVLLTALALILCLTGCGGKQTEKDPANGASGTAKYSFSLAHHHAVDSITDHLCTTFAKLVSEKTNGAVEITTYPSGQLGTEQEVADGLLAGTQEFGTVTAAVCYVDSVDGFGVDTLPFIFSSWDEINYAFNEASESLGGALNEKLKDAGARVLGWVPCSGRQMIFVDKDITSYKQIKGLTMRSPESTLYTQMFKSLGASPVPITWSECYSAMQTKVADGMETPISSIRDMNFVEVTKYCLMTNHMWSTLALTVTNDVYDSLPEEYQKAVSEAAREASQLAFEEGKQAEAEDIEYCKGRGMVFNEMSEKETDEMADLMNGMKEEWLKGRPARQEIYDLCLKAVEEYAAKQ